MTKIDLIPFEPEHIPLLTMRPDEDKWFESQEVIDRQMTALAHNAISGSLFVDDKLVAVIGWLPLWKGVVEVWSFPCADIHRYAVIYLKTVLKQLEVIHLVAKPHRIQTHSQADPLHDRWMKRLGFTCEGTLKQYSCDREDFRIWALWAEPPAQ